MLTASNSLLLMHIYSKFLTSRERNDRISWDLQGFCRDNQDGSNGKKLQIILVLIFEFFFVVSQLNYFVLKVVDLEPFNDTWRKKRSVPN
jgi:hypothetical protein